MSMHPDDEIDEEFRALMNNIARSLDSGFNGNRRPRKVCFVLMLAPFGDDVGRVNYISNGDRKDIVTMLKEVIARFEGQPEVRGHA